MISETPPEIVELSAEIARENGDRDKRLRAKCGAEQMSRFATLTKYGDPANWGGKSAGLIQGLRAEAEVKAKSAGVPKEHFAYWQAADMIESLEADKLELQQAMINDRTGVYLGRSAARVVALEEVAKIAHGIITQIMDPGPNMGDAAIVTCPNLTAGQVRAYRRKIADVAYAKAQAAKAPPNGPAADVCGYCAQENVDGKCVNEACESHVAELKAAAFEAVDVHDKAREVTGEPEPDFIVRLRSAANNVR